MIHDVKTFKSELKLLKHYRSKIKAQNELLRYTYYPTAKSPNATEDFKIIKNGKVVCGSHIPPKVHPTKEQLTEMEYRVYEERERINRIIQKYETKVKDIEETLQLLPELLRFMVIDVYVNEESMYKTSMKYGYSITGLRKHINSNLIKVIEK